MPLSVYCAGKSRTWPFFQALRACGLPIISSWIDWEPNHDDSYEPSNDEYSDHSVRCLKEAASCDILLLYVDRSDTNHNGALLEAGAALAGGRARVFLVCPHPWKFLRNHPRCRSFDSLADAVAAILAAQAGEKLRVA